MKYSKIAIITNRNIEFNSNNNNNNIINNSKIIKLQNILANYNEGNV